MQKHTVLSNTHKCWHLPVVWCGEDSYTFAIMSNLVALLFHFVAANDVVEIIQPQESIRNIWTEVNADASLAWRPAALWLRVGPQQLTHRACYTHVYKAIIRGFIQSDLMYTTVNDGTHCTKLLQVETVIKEVNRKKVSFEAI